MKLPKIALNFRTLFWGAAALVVLVLLVLAFRPQPVLVDLGAADEGALTVMVRDEGRTRVREVYAVSAPIGGRLLRVGNRAGERVQAGEVVASILPGDPALLDARSRSEAEAAVRSAEAALVFAQAEAERAGVQAGFARTEAQRIETLFQTGVASQGALDRVRLELRTAQAGLNTARANVARVEAELAAARARLNPPANGGGNGGVVEIRAPVSGRVLRVLQESESVVAPGTPVMEIGDPADLEVVAEFLSTDAVQVREGAEARIEAWGGADALRGRVRLVEPYGFLKISALGVEEQRVNVIIDFLDEPALWSALGHGYRVEAAVVVWHEDNATRVPVAALFRQDGGWAVFRAVNGRARLTMVETGRDDGRMAQVVSGLQPGEAVVLYPGRELRDGAAIRRRGG